MIGERQVEYEKTRKWFRINQTALLCLASKHQFQGNKKWGLYSLLTNPVSLNKRVQRRTKKTFAQSSFVLKINCEGSVVMWGSINMQARTELAVVDRRAMAADH